MYVCIMSMQVRNIAYIIEVVHKEDFKFVHTFEFSVNSFQSYHILLSEIYKMLSTKNNEDDKPFLWHWTWFLDNDVIPIWEQQNSPPATQLQIVLSEDSFLGGSMPKPQGSSNRGSAGVWNNGGRGG